MSFKLQLSLAGICIVTGLILAGIYAWAGHILGALNYLMAGILAAFISVFGVEVIEEWWWQIGAAIFMVIGIYAVLLDSNATNINLQEAQNILIVNLVEMEGSPYQFHLDSNEVTLVKQGVIACSMQGLKDVTQAADDLFKAERFGPIMTLIDGINSTTSSSPKSCLDYYRDIKKTKPQAFADFDAKFPELAHAISK